ncbi:MAG: formate dehydrogenase accessory sulfurtransferase FdhD [Desulfobacteraceae bacterium]|nr:MAG: formate dehydrogenase accessory sulfurtransferase FdhD [Desulfobacteraceae bacterium]
MSRKKLAAPRCQGCIELTFADFYHKLPGSKGFDVSVTPIAIDVWQHGQRRRMPMDLLDEEPLSIRVQGRPYAVVMRTPGDDLAHAAGFCLTEGLIDTPEDIVNLAACDMDDTNVVTVTLTPQRQQRIAAHLDRRGYISQSGCGLCGKTLIDELVQELQPVKDEIALPAALAEQRLLNLEAFQPLRERSAASHAAVLFDADLNPLTAAEDVGRHNALDKAIGRLFLDRRLHLAKAVMMSSRISYELVQKTARARIPIFLALSRPTRLAVDLATNLDISLAGYVKSSGLYLYCHARRFLD